MAKRPTITTIAQGFGSTNQLNTNFENIRDKFDDVVSRDGSTPNTMEADFDMNSNDILNAKDISTSRLYIGGQLVTTSATTVNVAVAADFTSVSALVASTEDYTDRTAGEYVRVLPEGYIYEVAASGATDHHLTTTGGVKLYVQPTDGVYSLNAFNPAANGTTDDTTVVQTALDAAAGATLKLAANTTYLVYAMKVSADTCIDFNGSTFKKRPAVSPSDDDDLDAWVGSPGVFATSGVYRPMFFLNGDNITFKNGTLNNDRASETIALGQTGGSALGRADRNFILGDESAAALDKLTILDMEFQNALGYGISVLGVKEVTVRGCKESGAYGPFANLSNTALATDGRLTFINNDIGESSPRSSVNVPNCFVFDSFDFGIISGNKFDGTSKVLSTVTSNIPDGGKVQNILNLNVSNNVFLDSGIKHAAGVGFAGESLIIQGNSFLITTGFPGVGGVTGGGQSSYNHTLCNNNIFQNCELVLENSPNGMIVSNNIVNILEEMNSGGTWEFFGLVNNASTATGYVHFINNHIDMGGFAGHVALREVNPFGTLKVLGGYITGCDSVWLNSASGTHDADRIIFENVDLSGNRSMGRFRFNTINCVLFRNCIIHAMDSTAPTNHGGSVYTGRGSFHCGSGGTWGQLMLIDNQFLDTTNDFKWEFEGSSTITEFVVKNNYWLSDEVGLSFDGNTVTQTISYAHVVDNVFGNTFQWSTNHTISGAVIRNNDFKAGSFTNDPSGYEGVSITGRTETTVGAAGGASALPATPSGYVIFDNDGSDKKMPYYDS